MVKTKKSNGSASKMRTPSEQDTNPQRARYEPSASKIRTSEQDARTTNHLVLLHLKMI
ncbi:MAG: hypothetical protein WBA39_34565 [Rivularia sp. (in: cyanobacteria)]